MVGLVFEVPVEVTNRDRTLRTRKRRALANGFVSHSEGDAESILLFDPANAVQSLLAILLVGAKPKRIPSVRQLEVLIKARVARRNR